MRLLLITLILALTITNSFAISPGAGQAQIQNNLQQMKQSQQRMQQTRQQQQRIQQNKAVQQRSINQQQNQ